MSSLPQPTIPLAIPNQPNVTTIATTLSSCPTLTNIKQVHAQILRSKRDRSNYLLKLLLSSCSISSSTTFQHVLSAFSHFPTLQPHLSNHFLHQLSRSHKPHYALLVYQKIRKENLPFDCFSFPPLLKAVSQVSALAEGMEIHGVAAKYGFDSDPFVQTALVRMYAACGKIMDARLVFEKMSYRDVVAWSIMIDGYCYCGLFDDALELFEGMKSCNVKPDGMILSTIISACGHAGNLSYGKAIHDFIAQNNIIIDSHLQSALITMYTSCDCMGMAEKLFNMSNKNLIVSTIMISGYSKVGRVEDACSIFNQMDEKDLICWSAMISGYAESDRPQEALKLFKELQVLGIQPDQITMLSVISACAHLGTLDQAKWVHIYVDKYGFGESLAVNNALIDMYGKCGSLACARGVFDKMLIRNVISWTSMISAFAIHGDAISALSFFHGMKKENVEPNWVTFVGVLYACSHAGLVEEGQEIFASMVNKYNIIPKHEHYGCMVDLFGRANLLRDAIMLIETMPLAPNVVIWGSLMAACRVHGETELGEFAAKRVLELEPDHDGALVLLSNFYARERRWKDVGELRQLMKQKGIYKEKGCSRIELNEEVHEFLMADTNHKCADEIYEKLDEVVSELKLVGYAPSTLNVLMDVDEEEKKEVVLWHSEKLALCYGLMREEKGSCIRIVKNLRVCEDCHTFIKLVSKVYERVIVVRDRTRFHHYKDGICSCNDYW